MEKSDRIADCKGPAVVSESTAELYKYEEYSASHEIQTRSAAETLCQPTCLSEKKPDLAASPETDSASASPLRSASRMYGPRLRLVHFNDVYDVYPPPSGVGGAMHFATAIKEKKKEDPNDSCLVFFSGDIFSPSQLSQFSRGRQMAYLLNLLDVHTACYGNHDLDYGWQWLEVLSGTTNCKWIVSNATLKGSEGHPLANAQKYRIFEWGPHRILTGIVGLIERDWIDLLPRSGRADIVYEDYVQAGRKCANMLRDRGCQLVIALTHMRWYNDEMLAQQVDGIDVILGGHDHEYGLKTVNGRLIVKSGTDFRSFSSLTLFPKKHAERTFFASAETDSATPESLDISAIITEDGDVSGNAASLSLKPLRRAGPPRVRERDLQARDETSAGYCKVLSEDEKGGSASQSQKPRTPGQGADALSKDFIEDTTQSTAASSEHSSNIWTKSPDPELSPIVERLYSGGRWWVLCEKVPVRVDAYAADNRVTEMLTNCERAFGVTRNTETLGAWPELVEARFRKIRTGDCNSGRWVTDLIRAFADADVGIVCAGSIRADCIFEQGDLVKMCTLQELLPIAQELRTIAVPGRLFKSVLENSVSKWPQLEGRFLQVSGLRFVFDGKKVPGERVLEEQIRILDKRSHSWVEVDHNKVYKVVGSVFLIEGGDGYSMLSRCEQLAFGRDGVEPDVFKIAELWWRRRQHTVSHEKKCQLCASKGIHELEWLDAVKVERESDGDWRIRNVACGDVLRNTFPCKQRK